MPITVNCECGRALRVKDSLAGKKGRCPECKEILDIPDPEEAHAQSRASGQVRTAPKPKVRKSCTHPGEYELGDAPEDEPTPRARRSRANSEEYVLGDPPEDDEPAPPRRRKPRTASADFDLDGSTRGESTVRKKRKKPKYRSEEDDHTGGGIVISSGVVGGLFAMVGAAVWFFVALNYYDRIFFYPPVLFVLGLISVIRGMMGYEEE